MEDIIDYLRAESTKLGYSDNIGANIRAARLDRGLTQKQLGDLCGMADSAIRRHESGRSNPTFETLKRIANALDVSTAYLQGFAGMNDKRISDAITLGDFRTAEKLLGLPEGSMQPVPPEELAEIEIRDRKERHTKELVLNKLRIYFRSKYDKLTDQDYLSIKSLIDTFSQLNDEGQAKAVERVEELTEIPKYKKEPPQD